MYTIYNKNQHTGQLGGYWTWNGFVSLDAFRKIGIPLLTPKIVSSLGMAKLKSGTLQNKYW